MRVNRIIVLIITLVMAFSGIYCTKSESPTESSTSDFVGNWKAGSAIAGTQMSYTNKANPSEVINVTTFGGTLDIVVKSDNSYNLNILVAILQLNIVEEGKISVSGDKVTLTPTDFPDDAITFKYSLNSDMLSLVDENSEFDFGFDEVYEPAILNIILKKM